jgi:DNA-binding CsgD family transcriptional regulator
LDVIAKQAESKEFPPSERVVQDKLGLRVCCGDEQLGKELSRLLSQRVSYQKIRLLLDIPRGWLSTLESTSFSQTLIVTDNPCPEYQLDLLGHHPAGMVLSLELNCILRAMASLQKGETFLPTVRSSLTRAERSVLYLSAIGRSAKDMAKQRDTSIGTVNNVLHVIYQKLGLGSRVELAHYYFGNWHLLEGLKHVA